MFQSLQVTLIMENQISHIFSIFAWQLKSAWKRKTLQNLAQFRKSTTFESCNIQFKVNLEIDLTWTFNNYLFVRLFELFWRQKLFKSQLRHNSNLNEGLKISRPKCKGGKFQKKNKKNYLHILSFYLDWMITAEGHSPKTSRGFS